MSIVFQGECSFEGTHADGSLHAKIPYINLINLLNALAFGAGRAQTGDANNLMPKLLLTNAKGKRHSVDLVPASSSQQPNEVQMRQLDRINKILPADILSEMSARKLAIPPREIALLQSRLKTAADLSISIGD